MLSKALSIVAFVMLVWPVPANAAENVPHARSIAK